MWKSRVAREACDAGRKKRGLNDRLSSRAMEASLHLPLKVRAMARPLREDIRERFAEEM